MTSRGKKTRKLYRSVFYSQVNEVPLEKENYDLLIYIHIYVTVGKRQIAPLFSWLWNLRLFPCPS